MVQTWFWLKKKWSKRCAPGLASDIVTGVVEGADAVVIASAVVVVLVEALVTAWATKIPILFFHQG